MKKIIAVTALLAGAVSGYSQGTLAFSDYGGTYSVAFYGVQTSGTLTPVTYNGYTVNEIQGNVTYPSGGKLSGSGYTIQVMAAAGSGDSLSALTPLGSTSGFLTGGFAGLFSATVTDTLTGVPAGPTTIALCAWQNTGADGAADSLATAQADGYAWGISSLASIITVVAPTTPPALPAGITSFSLGTAVPEPSTIALGVIGASAFLMRLRRKQ
jgi:hypothetical protein